MPPTAFTLDEKVRAKVDECPLVKSLLNIETMLAVLSGADEILTSDIAKIIKDDPILTARLLKLANSGLFGLKQEVTCIEQVVALLGLNNIRELFLASPIIEEVDKLHRGNPRVLPAMLHQHCHHSLGAAIITRDIISYINVGFPPEADYLIGLLHNVGKVVIDLSFPEECPAPLLEEEEKEGAITPPEMRLMPMAEQDEFEKEVTGYDYGEIGAYYLSRHELSETIIDAIAGHRKFNTGRDNDNRIAVALGLAVETTRLLEKKALGQGFAKAKNVWEDLEGWQVLFNPDIEEERLKARTLKRRLLGRAYKFEL
tara:strand:- start:10313 stop:11254 length:942 start_codon:yes stop_codon:yes gene_type:complete